MHRQLVDRRALAFDHGLVSASAAGLVGGRVSWAADRETPAHRPALDPVLRPVVLEDRGLFEGAFAGSREPISDMTFSCALCWADSLELQRAVISDHLCVFSAADGDLSMMLPPMPLWGFGGVWDGAAYSRVLGACFEIMDAFNASGPGLGSGPRQGPGRGRSRIEYVSDEVLDRIRSAAGTGLSAAPMPGDFVYSRASLVELVGGELKSKRKMRSRFLRENPDVETGPIGSADLDECRALLSLWRTCGDERHEGEANHGLIGVDVLRERDERCTLRYLELIDGLGLESMLVRSAGRLVGFTIGERLTDTMGSVVVEKTHPGFAGTPQFIYSEFCRTRFGGATEINAGDDWGIESLRFAKQSYRPQRMLSKNVLTRQPIPETGAPESATVRLLSHGRPAQGLAHSAEYPSMEIRPATASDTAAMVLVEAEAFADPDDRFTHRQIRRLVANPRARVAVAEHGGEVVGWCVALIRSHRGGRTGRVYSVAVVPALAGRGTGRAMLGWMLDRLEADGIGRVYLEVRAANAAAISLYESAGFVKIRDLPGYYGNGVDGVRMLRSGTGPSAGETSALGVIR